MIRRSSLVVSCIKRLTSNFSGNPSFIPNSNSCDLRMAGDGIILGYKQCVVNPLLFELQIVDENWQDLFFNILARVGRIWIR